MTTRVTSHHWSAWQLTLPQDQGSQTYYVLDQSRTSSLAEDRLKGMTKIPQIQPKQTGEVTSCELNLSGARVFVKSKIGNRLDIFPMIQREDSALPLSFARDKETFNSLVEVEVRLENMKMQIPMNVKVDKGTSLSALRTIIFHEVWKMFPGQVCHGDPSGVRLSTSEHCIGKDFDAKEVTTDTRLNELLVDEQSRTFTTFFRSKKF